MAFGLRDLDSGLFYTGHGWTHTPKFAQHFEDREEVEKLVHKQDIKNAELVFMNSKGTYLGGTPIRIQN